jgi:hypothetical protein
MTPTTALNFLRHSFDYWPFDGEFYYYFSVTFREIDAIFKTSCGWLPSARFPTRS